MAWIFRCARSTHCFSFAEANEGAALWRAHSPKGRQRRSKRPVSRRQRRAGSLSRQVLFATVALVFYTLSDNDLPEEFRNLLHWLRLNPERQFFHNLAEQIGKITEARMVFVGAGSFLYSLFSLVEGVGLMFRVSWAGWMAIGESAFFIPIEVYELSKGFSIYVFVILLLNIFIVWYLFQNRHRLFRHHHHADHSRHED